MNERTHDNDNDSKAYDSNDGVSGSDLGNDAQTLRTTKGYVMKELMRLVDRTGTVRDNYGFTLKVTVEDVKQVFGTKKLQVYYAPSDTHVWINLDSFTMDGAL